MLSLSLAKLLFLPSSCVVFNYRPTASINLGFYYQTALYTKTTGLQINYNKNSCLHEYCHFHFDIQRNASAVAHGHKVHGQLVHGQHLVISSSQSLPVAYLHLVSMYDYQRYDSELTRPLQLSPIGHTLMPAEKSQPEEDLTDILSGSPPTAFTLLKHEGQLCLNAAHFYMDLYALTDVLYCSSC